ncbi:hypothetical protein IANJMKHF_00220 [Klebsiella phage CPRSA]|nr:hypothetical protein IANJMKHF_00220 [Klebsiella phage CPRSA]
MSDLILNETKRVLFKAGSYIVATPKRQYFPLVGC